MRDGDDDAEDVGSCAKKWRRRACQRVLCDTGVLLRRACMVLLWRSTLVEARNFSLSNDLSQRPEETCYTCAFAGWLSTHLILHQARVTGARVDHHMKPCRQDRWAPGTETLDAEVMAVCIKWLVFAIVQLAGDRGLAVASRVVKQPSSSRHDSKLQPSFRDGV